MSATQELHRKYRPQSLDQMIGQDIVVKSLKDSIKKNGGWPHSILFTGNAGCGKTSLARIMANDVGCAIPMEFDAASHSGVDDVRTLIDGLKYAGFGDSPNKVVIIDEAHSLSKNAWQALLKTLEEPLSHVYFALCTTEIAKVPETIQTRCQCFALKDVRSSDLMELLEFVSEEEQLGTPEEVLRFVSKESNGSPRKALTTLSKVHGCSNVEEVRELMESAEGDEDVISLCKLLIGRQKPTWEQVTALLGKMKDKTNPESVRIVLMNYMASCCLRAKKESEALKFLEIMDQFATPYNQSEKMAPLILSLGRVLFGGSE